MSDDGPLWLRQLRTEVLRRLRAQHSTQAALAAHLGITPKHMSQVLTGKVNVLLPLSRRGRGRPKRRTPGSVS